MNLAPKTPKENLKKTFRQFAKKTLFSLSKDREIFRDKKITKQIEAIISQKKPIYHKKARNVLVYMPQDSEVNILPLINALRKSRYTRVFLPFVIGDSFKIVPFRLPLRKNKYNILEAKNSQFTNFNKIDLAVVPILGVDMDFKRIGFGKGMYDRFYDSLKKKPYSIFVCRILHIATLKIGDSYDIRGDTIISAGTRKGDYDFLDNHWLCCRRDSRRRICVFDSQKGIYRKGRYSPKTSEK